MKALYEKNIAIVKDSLTRDICIGDLEDAVIELAELLETNPRLFTPQALRDMEDAADKYELLI